MKMWRINILFFLFFWLSQYAFCQTSAKISNVDFRVDNNRIIVTFDIENFSPDELFTIELKFTADNNQVINPLTVKGDIGVGISGGKSKIIIWDLEKDQVEFSGTLKAVVTIKSLTITDINSKGTQVKKSRINGNGGPAYAGLSVLVPGLGGYFVEKNKIRSIVVTAATVCLMAYGIYYKVESNKYYSDYQDGMLDSFNEANSAQHKYYVSTRIGAAIWISDILWVTYKGIKNMNRNKSSGSIINSGNLGLKYCNNTVQLNYTLVF